MKTLIIISHLIMSTTVAQAEVSQEVEQLQPPMYAEVFVLTQRFDDMTFITEPKIPFTRSVVRVTEGIFTEQEVSLNMEVRNKGQP